MILRFLILAMMFYSGGAKAQERPLRWEPVPPGIVLTRNFMVPRSPGKDGYRLLPGRYQLGSKAYAKAPPTWWLRMAVDAQLGEKWHPKDFPLAYAGEFKSKGGSNVLLVVQVSQEFTGDGFFSPGPVLYLVGHLFSEGVSGPKLLTEQVYAIGDFQFSRLFAGEANGRQVKFRTDGAGVFDSRKIEEKRDWTLDVDYGNSFTIKKGEWQWIMPKKDFDSWYAKFGSDVQWVGYQGSVEQCHYFTALMGNTWRWFRSDQDEVNLVDKRPVPAPLDGTNAFYAIDPSRGFQKVEAPSLGEQGGAANGSQPFSPETNRTSSAAGSRR